jgi:hypothetical protein
MYRPSTCKNPHREAVIQTFGNALWKGECASKLHAFQHASAECALLDTEACSATAGQ